ncbi:MAG: hypothetical protein LBU62_08715 [Bacteroidales bacterium]|jgi:hypothetical protein|nr:hypothetical protein [Bacteroidales bacterium]
MYRQVFTPTIGDISFSIPPSWYGQQIEVIAFPLTDTRQEPDKDLVAERRRKLIENNKKYSVSFKEIGFKFDRDEANNYD